MIIIDLFDILTFSVLIILLVILYHSIYYIQNKRKMIFELAELIVVLSSIFSFGYYLHLAGQYKGFLKAIEVYLKYEEKENEDNA